MEERIIAIAEEERREVFLKHAGDPVSVIEKLAEQRYNLMLSLALDKRCKPTRAELRAFQKPRVVETFYYDPIYDEWVVDKKRTDKEAMASYRARYYEPPMELVVLIFYKYSKTHR